jgi:hypothetical protein
MSDDKNIVEDTDQLINEIALEACQLVVNLMLDEKISYEEAKFEAFDRLTSRKTISAEILTMELLEAFLARGKLILETVADDE